LINALLKAGLSEIEVCSFVRADRVPQMADAEALCAALPLTTDQRLSGLFLNPQGFERAQNCTRLRNRLWIPIALSETFLLKNTGKNLQSQRESIAEWCRSFATHKLQADGFMISTAFGCAYEGLFPVEACLKLLEELVPQLGNQFRPGFEFCFADTVGVGCPKQVRQLLRLAQAAFPQAIQSLHLHDTKRLGVANAYAGLEEGVRIFESSIAGLGGCPFTKGAAGNVATEDLFYLFEREGFSTGLNEEALKQAQKLAQQISAEAYAESDAM
jgi:hydroxymethylglutaryl-CoA lyase